MRLTIWEILSFRMSLVGSNTYKNMWAAETKNKQNIRNKWN